MIHSRGKALRRRIAIRQIALEVILIGCGVLSAGLGLRGFLMPNEFLDGGVTGISLLTNQLTHIKLPILLIGINLPFVLLGLRQISLVFAVKTFCAIVGLALAVAFIPYPELTEDKLLIAVFGGFFLGMGIGLAIRGGAVLDGTEVLAVFISRKSSLTVGDVILIFNIVIFSFAAILTNIEIALYAILTFLAASKTVDFIIAGFEEYNGMTIISDKSDLIRKMITEKMRMGVTIFKGRRGFGKRGHTEMDLDIIYTVITRLEIQKLKDEIVKIDQNAFIIQQSISDTKGGMVKRRPLH